MRKKGDLQISFSWLFAIIAGITILSLSIFVVSKIIGVGERGVDAETATRIGLLLSPLEIGFESVRTTTPMVLPSETRIHNNCDPSGNFGLQRISISQRSLGRWTDANLNTTFQDRYLFSDKISEGKTFFLLSAPLEYPFKIGSVVSLYPESKKYCFRDPPEEIESEMANLIEKNIEISECSEESIEICFNSRTCDINVIEYDLETREGYLLKNNSRFDFAEGLFYGAIFSDKEVYDCQVERLAKRASMLTFIYQNKALLVSQKDCNTNIAQELVLFSNLLGNIDSSEDLLSVRSVVNEIKEKNDRSICKLW